MATQAQTQIRSETSTAASNGDTVLGLLAAGAVGVYKAADMTNGVDVLLCLLGAVAAFGMVYYICFAKR